MSAKHLFDLSLDLKMKEQLLIPVHSKQQQESLRVSLSYNRRVFNESTSCDFDILVSKMSKGEKHYVSLTKVPRITAGIIISPDGSTRSTSIDQKYDDNLPPDECFDENQRIRAAMKADGYTDEQIEEYFSKPSNIDTLLGQEEILDE